MRPEFIPADPTDKEISAYRDALTKVGIGVETTAEALDNACRHVTGENACISSDVISAYPQAVNMIVHGGFEDVNGRALLVLPRDREAFRIVRDALADSHTSIPGFATRYVEVDLIQAIELTAARVGMPLGPRSSLTLPGWYTIFPSSGDDAQARRHDPRPVFDRSGSVIGEVGVKGGSHVSHYTRGLEHAAIDIPDPASAGLPDPCFLDAYLSDEKATGEVRPGMARIFLDMCYLDREPHEHQWRPFWAYVPDYSSRRWCVRLSGERCVAAVRFKKPRRGKAEGKHTCPATRKVVATKTSTAVLMPQPPEGWRLYGGLEPQRGHVHLWHRERVRWSGDGVLTVEFFYCPLCDAEAWPVDVRTDPLAYMSYGPAIEKVVKGVKLPKEVRSAFVEDPEQRGAYHGQGRWDKPAGIHKRFKELLEKTEREFSKEIADFTAELGRLGSKGRRKAPLSAYLEASSRVAAKYGRRWRPPAWVVEDDLGVEEEDEAEDEALEDES